MIVLFTDYGTNGPYVGQLKNVIAQLSPDTLVIDLMHDAPSFDAEASAYLLAALVAEFPDDTIFLCVVDPGVGSQRSILALNHRKHFFIAPDNGVLTLLLNAEKSDTIIRVDNTNFFLKPLSSTFHGRDIFAAVGAHLSCGTKLEEFGSTTGVRDIVHLEDLNCRLSQRIDSSSVPGSVRRACAASLSKMLHHP